MMGDADNTGIFLEKMADFFRYNVRKMEEDAMLWEAKKQTLPTARI